MKKFIRWVVVYVSGVILNLAIINKCYKVNFAYTDGLDKSFLKSLCSVSYFATPAIAFVCWDSNREWCNK